MKRQKITNKQRFAICERDKSTCQDCGKVLENYWHYYKSQPLHKIPQIRKTFKIVDGEIHHIVPVAEGGEHVLDNMILLCTKCHKNRTSIIMKYDKNRTVKERELYKSWGIDNG